MIDALGKIGTERTLPILYSALSDQDPEIRKKACQALSELNPDASPANSGASEGCAQEWLLWKKSSNVLDKNRAELTVD